MILGISAGKEGGNTDVLVKAALKECEDAGLETSFINISKKDIKSCTDCGGCRDPKVDCTIRDDMDEIRPMLESAEGIIVGSPTYFGNMSSHCALMFERTLPLRRHDFKLKNKVGGAIAVGGSRNGGQEYVLRSIHAWMLIHDMIVVGDSKPSAHFGGVAMGRGPGDSADDEPGMNTSKNMGKKVAETVKLLSK